MIKLLHLHQMGSSIGQTFFLSILCPLLFAWRWVEALVSAACRPDNKHLSLCKARPTALLPRTGQSAADFRRCKCELSDGSSEQCPHFVCPISPGLRRDGGFAPGVRGQRWCRFWEWPDPAGLRGCRRLPEHRGAAVQETGQGKGTTLLESWSKLLCACCRQDMEHLLGSILQAIKPGRCFWCCFFC